MLSVLVLVTHISLHCAHHIAGRYFSSEKRKPSDGNNPHVSGVDGDATIREVHSVNNVPMIFCRDADELEMCYISALFVSGRKIRW